MNPQIFKIHSDFYYVKYCDKIHTCKIREILKKQKQDVVVGDFVSMDKENNFIVSVLDRKNFLSRPKVANIDLALVVASVEQPKLDLIQLNRYLIYLKYHKIDAAVCFNKTDLLKSDFRADEIYKKLGYKTFLISAKNGQNLLELKDFIKGKTIVLTGLSGVGKSTLINALDPSINLKTSEVSTKTLKGTHTTRHVEIIESSDFKIIDAPGFSNLKFDFILPNELVELFCDIAVYKKDCKYTNCLHTLENKDCFVIKNLDNIEKSRYESYLRFLEETLSYKEKISKESIKKEKSFKLSGSKTLSKISKNKRNLSRKTQKQKLHEEQNGKI